MSLNRTTLIGNLGGDPEVRYQANGGAIANLTVATKETWRDKATGEQREHTEWHRVAVFGQQAQFIGEYARKGSQVYVEGKLQTRKWTDQNGIERYTTEIVVNWPQGKVELLGKRSEEPTKPQGQGQKPTAPAQPQNQQQPPSNYDYDEEPPF